MAAFFLYFLTLFLLYLTCVVLPCAINIYAIAVLVQFCQINKLILIFDAKISKCKQCGNVKKNLFNNRVERAELFHQKKKHVLR